MAKHNEPRAISNIHICSQSFAYLRHDGNGRGYWLLALDVTEDPDSAFTPSGGWQGRHLMISPEVFSTREEAEAAKAQREGKPFVAHQWNRHRLADWHADRISS